MKPQFRKIPFKKFQSFMIRHDTFKTLQGSWHYHPEMELHYVVKGEGVRFIGDKITKFSPGELILLGPNVPHYWKCGRAEQNSIICQNSDVELIVLHFTSDCLGKDFLFRPEASPIMDLFKRAEQNILFTGSETERIKNLLFELTTSVYLDRILIFLNILSTLASSLSFQYITRQNSYLIKLNDPEIQRVNSVLAYTTTNYMKTINLQEVADLCNLTKTSFCRFFKLICRKSFYEILTEIRISQACILLGDRTRSIKAVSNDCGFKNIANFYRHFNKIMGITPYLYRRSLHMSEVEQFRLDC